MVNWGNRSASIAAVMATAMLLLVVATAIPAGASQEDLRGDQLVGHDPNTGVWTMPDGRTFYYGDPADQPIMCDWDGDGIDTVGLYRSSTGFLHLRHSNDQGFSDIQIFYGIPEDLPVCGDWDGDGIDTIGILRPSESRFYLRNSNTQGFADFDFSFDQPGVPIAGDWDGDGIDTVGVRDAATGRVALSLDNTSQVAGFGFYGQTGDRFISGDWENEGVDRFGVVRDQTAILTLSTGDIIIDSGIAGTPLGARVSDWVPNGTILLGAQSVVQGGFLEAQAQVSAGATAKFTVTSPTGVTQTFEQPQLSLGPIDDLGYWAIRLDVTGPSGVTDPTPHVLQIPVVAAAPPSIVAVSPSSGTSLSQGSVLDLSVTATGQGPLEYLWSFSNGLDPVYEADPAGFVVVDADDISATVVVTDRFSRTSSAVIAVDVVPNQAPVGEIVSPGTAVAIPVGQTVTFDGTATDPDGDPVTLSWTFGAGSGLAESVLPTPGPLVFNNPGTYTVTLTAVDSVGTADLDPPTVEVTVIASEVLLINPGTDIQAVIDANPGPNTFVLGPGVHRGQSVRLNDYQTLEGVDGAILSGAETLTQWLYDGANDVWYVEGQTQQGRVTAEHVASGPVCRETNPRCRYPEDLFIDGEVQKHVTWLGEVAEGTWFFDYGADRIYVKTDPRTKLVETSVVGQGIYGGADHVTVRNLVVEKFATPTQVGAVDSRLYASWDGPDGTNWTVDNVEARFNHGTGIFVSDGGHIINSYAHHNGQQGFSARGYGVVVEGSELSHNNTVGYHWDFESGGGKYYRTYDMIFRDNWVHHNYGSGVWFDIANFNALIEDNHVEYNDFDGIFYEVSYGAIIRNNLVVGNGFLDHRGVWLWGAGIIVASSSDVEIYGNVVTDNWNGITGVEQQRGTWEGLPRHVTNLWVHDNLVTMDASLITTNTQYNFPANGYTGLGVDYGDSSFYESRGNRFESNDYEIPTGANLFHWYSVPRDWASWHIYGQDLEGTVTYVGNYVP